MTRDELTYGPIQNTTFMAVVGPFPQHFADVLLEDVTCMEFCQLTRQFWPSLRQPPRPAPYGWAWIHGENGGPGDWILLKPY